MNTFKPRLPQQQTVVLTLILCAALAACGGGGGSTVPTAASGSSSSSSSSSSGGSGGSSVVLSSGFPTSGSVTPDGGAIGAYQGSGDTTVASCNSGQYCASALGSNTPPATNNIYEYFQSPDFNTYFATSGAYSYEGIFVMAPNVTAISTTGNTTGVALSSQTSVQFTFNNNTEWASASNHNVLVELTLGNCTDTSTHAACTSATTTGNACNVQLQTVFTPTGGATATQYTLPLSGFIVAQNCGNAGLSSAATALSGNTVAKIDFQADGGASAITIGGKTTGFNSSVANSGGYYPTTLSVTGPITFQ